MVLVMGLFVYLVYITVLGYKANRYQAVNSGMAL